MTVATVIEPITEAGSPAAELIVRYQENLTKLEGKVKQLTAENEVLEQTLTDAEAGYASLERRMINARAIEVTQWRELKGFDMPASLDDANGMLGKLMLISCEVAEAAEDIRKGDHVHFREELADVVIRCLDMAGAFEINLEAEIDRKMAINRNRPYKHGKLA